MYTYMYQTFLSLSLFLTWRCKGQLIVSQEKKENVIIVESSCSTTTSGEQKKKKKKIPTLANVEKMSSERSITAAAAAG